MKSIFINVKNVGLVLSLLAVFAGAHQAAAQTFVLTSTNPVGAGPVNVFAADLNNDGKQDLICANDGDGTGNTVTVLTNNGSGIFGFNANYTVGGAPFVTAADLSGTGRRDLITANFNDGTLTVLTNNGSGVFASNATYTVGNGPFSVVAADVNNDTKLDLICANEGNGSVGNTVTVLTNNGNGVFGSNATYTVGNGPFVTAADLRASGKPDLITANYNDGTLTVLTNNGSGVFASNATYTVGNGPINVVAADVNNDSKPDLICANDALDGSGNTLTVLTNKGDGTFTFSATLVVGKNPFVAVADVNGDGKVDLISANYSASTLLVLTNNGSGVFGSNATYNVGTGPICVVAADVNNDGRQELISANYNSASLTVRLEIPMVAMQFTDQTATISWPPLWGGYVLQTNANLGIADWGNAVNPTGTNRLTFSAATGGNLFRLRHP